VEDDLTSRAEEQELKESVQDLLDHLVIFLLGSEEVLE
jgi:hypothetical protein